MSKEEQNILGSNIDPEFEKFLEASSKLVVPSSKLGKEATWDKLMENIEQQEIEEVKVVKFSYQKLWLSAAAAVIVLFTIASLTYRFAQVKVVSPKGEFTSTLLPDGSELRLNADSKIEYRKFGWVANREIELDGEAYFKVMKGSTFTVNANVDKKVVVTGTEFNVFTRGSRFEVKCFEGSVIVHTPNKPPFTINKGNGIVVKDAEMTSVQFDADSVSIPTWIKGEFFFNDVPLNEVFEELTRQFNITISIQNFSPESKHYTGYFQRTQLPQALDLVCIPMGLTNQISKEGTSVLIKKDK